MADNSGYYVIGYDTVSSSKAKIWKYSHIAAEFNLAEKESNKLTRYFFKEIFFSTNLKVLCFIFETCSTHLNILNIMCCTLSLFYTDDASETVSLYKTTYILSYFGEDWSKWFLFSKISDF